VNREDGDNVRSLLAATFFISFAAIGWQLALMRCLIISRYHHFSFLVISCALLGFGAGGVILALKGEWFHARRGAVFTWVTLGFALSLPLSFAIGESLPLNVYFPPVALVQSLGWWALFWLIHSMPFLLAGLLVGLALVAGGERVHWIYASNLAGSAAGALGSIALMYLVPANGLVVPLAFAVLLSAIFLAPLLGKRQRCIYRVCVVLSGLMVVFPFLMGLDRAFPLNVDQFKSIAYVNRLVDQGNAEKKFVSHGPRGRIELFSSPHFHTLLSLGSTAVPPNMDLLLRDGFDIGAVLSISNQDEAKFLQGTLTSLPYKLITPKRVLILGESSGVHVWLARMSQATSISVVQGDKNVIAALASHPSRVLDDPRIRVFVTEPRAFLDTTKEAFDIVHLAALEGFAAGSGGIGGLREDYLATVEGFGRCLDLLSPGGKACVVRGIQDPPRDNIKIAATWIEAAEQNGSNEAGRQILMARDELAVATLASRTPISPKEVTKFREVCRKMSWEAEWFSGIQPETTNRVHVLRGPSGTSVSWYHEAMRKLLSGDRDAFYRDWISNVRPATDDRPFFYDFFRFASISRLRETFGPLWPTRTEMGFLLLMVGTGFTFATALALLPAPILLLRRNKVGVQRQLIFFVMVFFSALAAGFMFIEMVLIQLFTRFIGDPVPAAALVIGAVLFFAGIGSAVSPAFTSKLPGEVFSVTVLIALTTLCYSGLLPCVFRGLAALDGLWKTVLGVLILAPPAFLMGMPFPWGMAALRKKAPVTVPLAWAINGFGSVVSACAAMVLAMSLGFKMLLALAALAYVLAGISARDLSKRATPEPSPQ
jgi:hypothetical protein